MIKYGKSYGDIAAIKSSFTSENEKLLKSNMRIADIYKKQPRRNTCIICGRQLLAENSFTSHGLSYFICEECGHINGEFEETSDFSVQVYDGPDYGMNYSEDSRKRYSDRLEKIYIPKAEFMINSFTGNDIDCKSLKYLDVGAGSGYFVGAMNNLGLTVSGIEISESQVRFANDMLGNNFLSHVPQNDVKSYIQQTSENVISFIGVLEHIVNLSEIMDAIAANKNIEYVFFSVPLFSYSVIFEAVSNDVFNRQLGGGHTHLFTEQSLSYMYAKYHWEILGEWRFGTDAADLLRILTVKMCNAGNNCLAEIFQKKYNEVLDDIQLLMDKSHFSSEIHVLVKKK